MKMDIDLINKHFFGKVITNVKGLEQESDLIEICFDNNESITMYHSQDCCEHVNVDDVVGPVDLSGSIFYELIEKDSSDATKKEDSEYCDDSFTWTFYTIKTSKGYTDIKWYGSSNGYYSERVDLVVDVKPLIYINNITISTSDTVHDIYRKLYNRALELGYNSRLININLCRYNISYKLYIETYNMMLIRGLDYCKVPYTINILNNYVDIDKY